MGELTDLYFSGSQVDWDMIVHDPIWFRGGPSHWDNIVSFAEDAYETAGEMFEVGYLSARVAFAAPFVFGAAALFSLTDQLLALIEPDYIY
jgi:hypothetical protein